MSEITTRAEEGAKLYVLMKRGLYWRPDAQGYTGVLADAGRYTAEKAAAYTHHDDPSVTAILASEADEFSPACWEETKLARRDKQLAAAESRAASAEAEVERLRKAIQDFLDGNYQHPRSYRPGKCPHDIWYFDECGSCNDEHFTNALKSPPMTNPTLTGQAKRGGRGLQKSLRA